MTAFNQEQAMSDWSAAAQAAQAANNPNQGGALSAGGDPSVAPGIGANDPYDPNNMASPGSSTMASSGAAPNLIPNRTPFNGAGGSSGMPRLPTQDPGSGGVPADLGATTPNTDPDAQGGALQGGGPQQPQNPNPQGDPGLPTAPGSTNGMGGGMEPGHQDAMSLIMNQEKDKVSPEQGDKLASNLNQHIVDASGGLQNLHSVFWKTYENAIKDEGTKAALQEQAARDAIPAMTLRDKAMYVIDAFQRAGIASGQGMPPGAAMAYGAQGAQDALNKKNSGIHDAAIAQSRQHEADAKSQATEQTGLAEKDNMGYLKYLEEGNKTDELKVQQQKADAADRKEADVNSPEQLKAKLGLTNAETTRANAEADAAQKKGAASANEAKGEETFTRDDGTTGTYNKTTGIFTPGQDDKGAPLTGKKTGTQGPSATDDKAMTNARETFQMLQKSEDARAKSGLNLNPQDSTPKVLETMRTRFPDQYDLMVGNPVGTTKKGAPSAQAPGPKGTTPAQQKVIDDQVKQDTDANEAATPKKPAWKS